MIVKNAYYPHQFPTKIVVELPDGKCFLANLTPFRRLSEKDLTLLAIFRPEMGDEIPAHTLRFYGLSLEGDNRLVQLRIEAGLTQKALSEAAGVNLRQIQKIEAGEIQIRNITLGTAKRLSDALGVEIADLLK